MAFTGWISGKNGDKSSTTIAQAVDCSVPLTTLEGNMNWPTRPRSWEGTGSLISERWVGLCFILTRTIVFLFHFLHDPRGWIITRKAENHSTRMNA